MEARDTLETAHRLRKHYSSVFRFAIAEGADLRDPCSEIRDALKRPAVRHFAAITKPAELTGLLKAIETYSGTLCVRAALKLSSMLIVRPGELRLARWEEFDLDHGVWYLPSIRMKRTKDQKINGEPHLVPLARQAVQILEELFQVTGESGCVFPSEAKSRRTFDVRFKLQATSTAKAWASR